MRLGSVAALATALALAACTGRDMEARTAGAPTRYAVGHAAPATLIASWNIDVAPSGAGLPPGHGSAAEGARRFATQCAPCHGAHGEGQGPYPRLIGREPREGFPFGRDPSLTRTIGNYWPYATTLYDYIRRAMPLTAPGSLAPDDVYALTAYLLAENDVIPRDAMMNAQTLPRVRMPARDRFVPDDRHGGPEVR